MSWIQRSLPGSPRSTQSWSGGAAGFLLGDYDSTTVYHTSDFVTYTASVVPDYVNGAASDGSTWFAVTSSGFFVSYDAAPTSWEGPISNRSGIAMLCNEGRLFVLDYSNVYTSDDSGTSWTLRHSGSGSSSGTWGHNQLRAFGSLVVATNGSAFVYVSIDNGDTWLDRGTGDPIGSAAIAVGGVLVLGRTGSGQYKVSTDGGLSWSAAGDATKFYRFTSSPNGVVCRYSEWTDAGSFTYQIHHSTDLETWTLFDAAGLENHEWSEGFLATNSVLLSWAWRTPNGYFTTAMPSVSELETLLSTAQASFNAAEQVWITELLVSQGVAGDELAARVTLKVTLVSNAAWADSVSAGVLLKALLVSAAQGQFAMSALSNLKALLVSSATGAAVETQPLPDAVWVLNTETSASTRYEDFDFNSFAKIDGHYYGCRSDGIYELDGDTDAGQPVQAMVSFGKQDFGTTALKRVSNIYIGTSSGGKLFVKVLVEGEEYLYQARDGAEELQVQRFDLGRGLRANYLEFELYNADGDDFELASVEFAAVPLTRRI